MGYWRFDQLGGWVWEDNGNGKDAKLLLPVPQEEQKKVGKDGEVKVEEEKKVTPIRVFYLMGA